MTSSERIRGRLVAAVVVAAVGVGTVVALGQPVVVQGLAGLASTLDVLLHGDVGRIPVAPLPAAGQRAAGAVEPRGSAVTTPDSGAAQARLVTAEDERLSQLVRGRPAMVPYEVSTGPQAEPTMVLTARSRPYGLSDLEKLGAIVLQPDASWLVIRSLFVAKGAQLQVQAPGTTLKLSSGPSGFASIVAAKGTLTLAGDATAPLTITSWDPATGAPDADESDGRAYVRAAGSRMDLSHVVATGLGFWSGRTGGIAWTGSSHTPSTGGSTDVAVSHGHYGMFSSRTSGLVLSDTTLQDNDLDGLLVHHGSVGLTARTVTAGGNGGDGVDIARGATQVMVEDATTSNNLGDGIRINGTPLARSATAGGASTARGAQYTVRDSTATGNAEAGILAMSADDVTLAGNTIGAGPDGIIVRGPAVGATISGNTVDVAGFGIAVRSGVIDARVQGNHVTATIGLHITDSAAAVDANSVVATRYGVSLVGHVDNSSVTSNTFDGRGLAAVDLHRIALATDVDVDGNDVQTFRTERDNLRYGLDYAQHHPVLFLWLLFLLVPVLARIWMSRRRRPGHPYQNTAASAPGPTPWIYTSASREKFGNSSERSERSGVADRPADSDGVAGHPATRLTLVSAGRP